MPVELSNFENRKNEIQTLGDNAFVLKNEILIISGDIIIKTNFSENDIYYRVWVKIGLDEFSENYESLKKGNEVIMNSEVLSEITFIDLTKGMLAKYKMQNSIFGSIELETECQIKTDQKNPITKDRFIQLMQRINHPELEKEKKKFDLPFKERIKRIIERAKVEYNSRGRNFVIDISNQKEIIIQIISSEMTEKPSIKGIGIHLSNDDSNIDFEIVSKRMSKICWTNSINKLSIDGIETYQKEYKFEDKSLIEDLKLILIGVFEEDIENLELDIS